MALDHTTGAHSGSPESSGRDSPIPRQWRNQLGGEETPSKDKAYRRYAAGVDKVLSLFDTTLEEWADYISFLNKLLKALQTHHSSITTIPSKAIIAKRLSQCLNPTLPSGVHQKALDVYSYIFSTIKKDGLSRDLPLYLPGLAPTLSFASLSVRSPFLDLLETHFLKLEPRSLRPAMKSIIMALLPGLEDETSEDFDRTLRLVAGFKKAIRPADSEVLTEHHSSGDGFFWQCFFLATITSQTRRAGSLAYLVRFLPILGSAQEQDEETASLGTKLSAMVTSPEPGLLVRCFASGLSDDQQLIQRGFLDLLVSHLPLNSGVLQQRVKSADLELLLKSATNVVTRRDMSLNRRLWAWLLGPEPAGHDGDNADGPAGASEQQQAYLTSRTSYFEEFGLSALVKALLDMIKGSIDVSAAERARPFRICLSLMDRWEIGGLVVPEIFLPVMESVRTFGDQASTKAEFNEVLRSASVFFDGIESGLIYSELVGLLAQAIGPGSLSSSERGDKLDLFNFVVTNFNVREEEMVTVHAPLSSLAALSMLEDARDRRGKGNTAEHHAQQLADQVLSVTTSLLELIPERAFPDPDSAEEGKSTTKMESNVELLKRLRAFYVHEQGNLDATSAPFSASESGQLLLLKAVRYVCDESDRPRSIGDLSSRIGILDLLLSKTRATYTLDTEHLLSYLRAKLGSKKKLPFSHFSSMLQLATRLYSSKRITANDLSELIMPLVRQAWLFLSASEPKYHVETVRHLWRLQTALSSSCRDIEAALAHIIIEYQSTNRGQVDEVDIGRVFSVLWSHTLQDNPSDRRGPKVAAYDSRLGPRLSGMDNFELMLTQPLFLVLDALLDERTQLFMTVKSWLNSMIGVDRLFLLFVFKISNIPFLRHVKKPSDGEDEKAAVQFITFSEDDDLDLCIYYLRTLYQVLRSSGDVSWAVLASKYLAFNGAQVHIRGSEEDGEMTLQTYFILACMQCIKAETAPSASHDLIQRTAQLQRYALTILHHFLLSRYAGSFAELHLENDLVDKLAKSIGGYDPYIQVLLLDVVYDALKLRDVTPVEAPMSPTSEKKRPSIEHARANRPSLQLNESRPTFPSMPASLIKCLQSGLSSATSQSVLDSWVAFLGECLPFYSNAIFQVLIPLVETLCQQIGLVFASLRETFLSEASDLQDEADTPESTLIYLLNGLEQVLGRAHDQLLTEESKAQMSKSPEQQQSLFGSMVSGVFQSDSPQSRSATANDRLTVHLAFQDAVRICYRIWSWGQGEEQQKQDPSSIASFSYTSLRMRNRARRLLEHLFIAEPLECLETVIGTWKMSTNNTQSGQIFNFLSALDASRPRHMMPALFNSIYSRTNPTALDSWRKSTMTISLLDNDLVVFLVEYTRSLDDDAMDEIWQDCITFLRDILGNPFPHRQTLPSLLEFASILGEKVDNTNFGEQRKMRKELGDLFLRLLAALFTTKPLTFSEASGLNGLERSSKTESGRAGTPTLQPDRHDDIIGILASVVPNLPKVLLESDRVLSAAGTISTNAIGPTLRSKAFPETVSPATMRLLFELSKLPNNQKTWKKDVGDAFNDTRFFSMDMTLVRDDWLPLLKQWILTDKDKATEMMSRISPPTTAGIVFGVGATSARLEADRKTQLNLRRVATLILASAEDAFVTELTAIQDKLVELLSATATSSPSSTTRADIFMVMRALVLRTSSVHLAALWPIVNTELHAAISSVVAPDHSTLADTYVNAAVLQACKLLDLLVCAAPDDFQLHEWLFVTDTIDAIYRASTYQPVALVDEVSEELGNAASSGPHATTDWEGGAGSNTASRRRPLLGMGGFGDDVSLERKDELVAKVLRPFFSQLSIYAFESVYAMGSLDREACVQQLLKDLFDDRTMVKAL